MITCHRYRLASRTDGGQIVVDIAEAEQTLHDLMQVVGPWPSLAEDRLCTNDFQRLSIGGVLSE